MISCAARAGWTADNYVYPKLGEGAGTLVTDRPGFSYRTETVAPWNLVLDLGYDYTHDDKRGVEANVHTFPGLLGRVGLTWLELRAQWGGYNFVHVDVSGVGSANLDAASDTAFGSHGPPRAAHRGRVPARRLGDQERRRADRRPSRASEQRVSRRPGAVAPADFGSAHRVRVARRARPQYV
jgi:hypothetical protein